MTTKQDSEPTTVPASRGILAVAVLVLAASAAMLWGASAITWHDQRFRTPFSGDLTFSATGATLRPELVPVALAALASIAAVLATGRWLRRALGVLLCLAGALLVWRAADRSSVTSYPGVPAGSTPIGDPSVSPLGPVLVVVAALALIGAGILVARYARRMPEMSARYSAPGAKRASRDPNKQLWDALDDGEDPTDG